MNEGVQHQKIHIFHCSSLLVDTSDILAETLEEKPAMIAADVRDALDSVSKGNFGEFESTEWSVVFDQSALTAVYYHRENYAKGYSFNLLSSE